jgi:hypothetical protein
MTWRGHRGSRRRHVVAGDGGASDVVAGNNGPSRGVGEGARDGAEGDGPAGEASDEGEDVAGGDGPGEGDTGRDPALGDSGSGAATGSAA